MKRKEDIDLLKGYGIFLMVFNHVGFGGPIHHYIQSFHMPLFFIVAGYLWNNSQEKVGHWIKRKAKTLLIPYLIYGFVFSVIWTIIEREESTNYILGGWINYIFFPTNGVPLGGPLWFLPCMFLSGLLYLLIRKKYDSLVKSGLIIAGVALLGSFYSAVQKTVELPFAIEPALTAILFMLFGETIRKSGEDQLSLSPIKLVILFFAATMVAFLNPTIDMRTSRYCIVPLYFLGGFLNTVFWWNIARAVEKNTKHVLLKKTIVYFSVNSIVFLLFNRLFIDLYDYLIRLAFVSDGSGVIVLGKLLVLFLSMITCVISAEILKQKDLRWTIGK